MANTESPSSLLHRCFLIGIAVLHLCLVSDAAFCNESQRRPNVLFILTDDQRWDALGLAGHPHLKTPHIDRLGKEGIYFRNAFCTTSLCSPSRASILSGQYAHKHGVKDNFTDYPAALQSFPKRLQQSGYATAYIGKWHMGEDDDTPRPGFDWFVTHKGQGKYFDTEFNLHGTERKVIPGYYTHVVTDLAEQWLEKQNDSRPWCLMIGHKAPHSFYFPEKKYETAFADVSVSYPDTAFQLADKPKWIKDRLYTWHGIYGPLFDWRKKFPDDSAAGVKDFEAMTRAYWGTLLSVDDSVGRLVQSLEQRGELENTIIVYMSDNGILNGEHGMVDKRTPHEPSIRIVQVAKLPKRFLPNGPSVIDQQVLTIDMAPSLLELCEADPLENIDGRSWVPLLKQKDAPWRKSWLYYYNYEKQFPYTPNVRAVRTDRWKYARYPHGDGSPDRHKAELYDLKADPEETRNLVELPEYASVLQEMKSELAQVMQSVGLGVGLGGGLGGGVGIGFEFGKGSDPMPIDEGVKQELPDQKIR